MELFREAIPFLIGTLLPGVVLLTSRLAGLSRNRVAVSFAVAIVVGLCVSFFAGEWAGGLPDAVMAIIIDTSLAYTGFQLAYRLAWKPEVAMQAGPAANFRRAARHAMGNYTSAAGRSRATAPNPCVVARAIFLLFAAPLGRTPGSRQVLDALRSSGVRGKGPLPRAGGGGARRQA
jgi:hypothetical protein